MTSARTRTAALFGFPATYSLSPPLHTAAYAAMGLDATYLVFPIESPHLGAAVSAAKTLGFLGVSVTIPHKEAVIEFCDSSSDDAALLGAVNTLEFTGGRVIGHNTDGEGFIRSLVRDSLFSIADSRVVIIGAGGAAKAVVAALGRHGAADISIVNRTSKRAAEVAALTEVARVGTVADLADADLVVNATPIGMTGSSEGQSPVPADMFTATQLVVDLVYAPAKTQFLLDAEARGAKTANGFGMLIHQASLQIELWTGAAPDVDAMRAAVSDR